MKINAFQGQNPVKNDLRIPTMKEILREARGLDPEIEKLIKMPSDPSGKIIVVDPRRPNSLYPSKFNNTPYGRECAIDAAKDILAQIEDQKGRSKKEQEFKDVVEDRESPWTIDDIFPNNTRDFHKNDVIIAHGTPDEGSLKAMFERAIKIIDEYTTQSRNRAYFEFHLDPRENGGVSIKASLDEMNSLITESLGYPERYGGHIQGFIVTRMNDYRHHVIPIYDEEGKKLCQHDMDILSGAIHDFYKDVTYNKYD